MTRDEQDNCLKKKYSQHRREETIGQEIRPENRH